MPDWDFFIPPRDENNFAKLNELLQAEIDVPLVVLGSRGENFIQIYQTRWGILQFHLGLPGVPRFDEAEKAAVIRPSEQGTPVKCLSGIHLLAAKRAADRPKIRLTLPFWKNCSTSASLLESAPPMSRCKSPRRMCRARRWKCEKNSSRSAGL